MTTHLGVPRIRRDRRAVGRLRAVNILPVRLQQDAEVHVRLGGVSWISQLFDRLTDDGMTDGALVK